MGLKYKNSSGGWVQIPIPSEINDKMTSATSTYSSIKIENLLASKAGKVNTVTFENGAELTLADNTEYYGTSILNLTLNYPQENFECYISFDIPTEGTINISLDQSKYIGILPNFTNGKSYEISIKNGVVICGEVIK